MRIRQTRAIAFTAAVAVVTALTQVWFGERAAKDRQEP
jgi:hypothetical protein